MSRRMLGHDVTGTTVAAAFVILGGAVVLAVATDAPLWTVPLGVVLPDLAFLAGIGSAPAERGLMPPRAVPVYNVVHHSVTPLIVAAAAAALGAGAVAAGAVAWLSHIVWDRGVGYRLRTADGRIRPARPRGSGIHHVAG